ncbi:hypothetical protein KP509_21G074400 [Ceratopteris richardii]|uniref:SET domain-containing protein n=1 Tax=Ceratopteris richardii TaxID=49495 RepID=A0A8T2SBY5_CERRI|nr:hypothetical protein KP509_21G074400 [Ceratopteris richardii]
MCVCAHTDTHVHIAKMFPLGDAAFNKEALVSNHDLLVSQMKEQGREVWDGAFNKQALVSNHERLARKVKEQGRKVCDSENFAVSIFSNDALLDRQVPVPIEDLDPILINELQVDFHHRGRVLYGKLCSEPVRMASVLTVLEDETGDAILLSVYNMLSEGDIQYVHLLFHKGLNVAIKEPFLNISTFGSLMIRVDNPSDLVHNPKIRNAGRKSNCGSSSSSSPPSLSLLSSSSSSLSLLSSSSSPSSSIYSFPVQKDLLVEARKFRNQGNDEFKRKDWKQAIKFYTEAVKSLLPSGQKFSSHPEGERELVLCLSNRAESRLRLKHYEAAERDARIALELQNDHAKSLFRRGKALHGLHQYNEAALCFQKVLNTDDLDGLSQSELENNLKASKLCCKQIRTGNYNLLGLCKALEAGQDLMCGEYVGPVEIGPSKDNRLGCGLRVTRAVNPGDLLIASRAIAHAKLDSSMLRGLSEEERNLLSSGSKSSSVFSTVYKDIATQVIRRAASSDRFRERIYSLSATSIGASNNIPPMSLFATTDLDLVAPGNSIADILYKEDTILSADKEEHIYTLITNNACQVAGGLGASLWLIPSFINHSCIPNACWMRIGQEILFVRAVRHLVEGEEVTISYAENGALPLSLRTSYLERCRGFKCRCERCDFEASMEPFMKQLEVKALDTLAQMDTLGYVEKRLHGTAREAAHTVAIEIVKSLEWAFQNISSFMDERKKHWFRTSFAAFYLRLIDDDDILRETIKEKQLLEIVLRAVQETLGASEDVLACARERVCLEECHPSSREIVAAMYGCLYGKQSPSSLKKLIALRHSILEARDVGAME